MKKHGYLAFLVVYVASGQDVWTRRLSTANHLQQEGKYEEAGKLYELAVADGSATQARSADALNNLAANYYERGKYLEAEPFYRKALEQWRALNEPGKTGLALSNLGALYRKTGRLEESLRAFRDAEPYLREIYGSESPAMVTCLINWSEAYRVAGRFPEAEETASRALRTSEKIFPEADPRLSHSLHAYAATLQSSGKSAETESLHERALAIREHAYGDSHPYVAATLNALVLLRVGQGRYADAEPLAKRALAIWEAKLGPSHPNTAIALNNLAQVRRFQGDGVSAEPLYRRAVDILQEQNSPEAAKTLTNVADFYLDLGRDASALAFYKRAEELARAAFGANDRQTIGVALKIAGAYERMGRKTEANRLRKQLQTVRATTASAFSR